MGFFNLHSIRFRLLAALVVALALMLVWVTQYQTRQTEALIHRHAAELLCQIAQRMNDQLVATLRTHADQVQLLSQLPRLTDPDISMADRRKLLERIRDTDPTIAWIGMTDANGTIIVDTGNLLTGKNVAHREWFIEGKKGLHLGNVHDAFLLAKLMPKPKWDDLPLRLMDISAPVLDSNGKLAGVLCMHLGWDFAFAARHRIAELSHIGDSEILVLDHTGRLLMGTEKLPSHAMTFDGMTAFRQAVLRGGWSGVTVWPDDNRPYLTQFLYKAHHELPGLDWIIAVRQPVESAFAEARSFVENSTAVLIVALATITLLFFVLVNHFFHPLETLTEHARRILAGHEPLKLPELRRKDEVGVLSRTLSQLLSRTREQIDQLEQQKRQLTIYAQLFEHAPLAIMITDPDNRIVAVNPAFEQITGYREKDVLGKSPTLLKSGRHDKAFYERFWQTLCREGSISVVLWNRRANGEIYPERLTAAVLQDERGEKIGYIGIFSDITEEERARAEIERLSRLDPLTELLNRHTFIEQLRRQIEQKRPFWLLFLDLDNFKAINDSLGHPVGDRLLQELAHRLKNLLPEGAFIGRYGGDEFLLCWPGDADTPDTLAARISEAVREPFTIETMNLQVGVTIGAAAWPRHAGDWVTLIKAADAAMLSIKHKVRDQDWRVYDASLAQDLDRRSRLLAGLRHALRTDGFQLAWQPKVNARTGRWESFEVLLRWQHEGEWVSPAEFIPLAEETGLIRGIDEWVLHTALATWSRWQQQGWTRGRSLAFNLSAATLRSRAYMAQICPTLEKHGIAPADATLELTETMVAEDSPEVNEAIHLLDQMGCHLSLDDFGTGHANLDLVSRLPLDQLKIDLRFVKGMLHSDKDRIIVEHAVNFAHALGLEVVAEGVETEEQAEALHQLNVDLLQGYLFSRPLLTEEMEARLQADDSI